MGSTGSLLSVQRAHRRATEDVGLLRAVLDVLEVGVALLDCRGQYLYRNRRFLELNGGAGEPAGLCNVIEALQVELLPKARALSGRVTGGPKPLGSADVPVGSGGYRVQGLALGHDYKGGGQALLITIERLPQEAGRKPPEKLRLTAQEARVARLLAEGCSNKEIAAELGIHPTTAKNHTQSVLQKLGVRRRSQVGPLLRTWQPE